MNRIASALRHRSTRLVATAAAALAVAAAGLLPAGAAQAATGVTARLVTGAGYGYEYVAVANSSYGYGASIIQWPLSGSEQVWTFQPSGGHFELVNKNSGLCIYADGVLGDWLYQEPCDGSSAVLWDFNLSPGNIFQGSLIRSVRTGLVMDVEGGSFNEGTHLIQWYANGGGNQTFSALTA